MGWVSAKDYLNFWGMGKDSWGPSGPPVTISVLSSNSGWTGWDVTDTIVITYTVTNTSPEDTVTVTHDSDVTPTSRVISPGASADFTYTSTSDIAGNSKTVNFTAVAGSKSTLESHTESGIPTKPIPPVNEATGGTIATISNYNGTGETWKTHTFTSSSSLNITKADMPFRVLVVGGGAHGGGGSCGTGQLSCSGYGGGSGGFVDITTDLTVSSKTITVGGQSQGSSISGSISVGGGSGRTGGSNGGRDGDPSNTGYGPSKPPLYSDITGTNSSYSQPGGSWPSERGANTGHGGGGAQRSGGDYPDGSGNNGASGIVVVAYRIG